MIEIGTATESAWTKGRLVENLVIIKIPCYGWTYRYGKNRAAGICRSWKTAKEVMQYMVNEGWIWPGCPVATVELYVPVNFFQCYDCHASQGGRMLGFQIFESYEGKCPCCKNTKKLLSASKYSPVKYPPPDLLHDNATDDPNNKDCRIARREAA